MWLNKIKFTHSKFMSKEDCGFDIEKVDTIIDQASETFNNVLFGKISKKEQIRLDTCIENDSGIRDPFYFAAIVQEKLGNEPSDPKDKRPKRPRSAYNFFTSESKKNGKRISEIGKEWKELNTANKGKYETLVENDKLRYQQEVEKYEEENGPIRKKLPRNDVNRKSALREAFDVLASDFYVMIQSQPQLTQKDVIHFQIHLHVATKMFLGDCKNLLFSMPKYDETTERGLAFIDTWISQAKEMVDINSKNDPELCVRISLAIMSVTKLHNPDE